MSEVINLLIQKGIAYDALLASRAEETKIETVIKGREKI